MYFDTGRQADLRNLEQKVRQASTRVERDKYQKIIDNLKRQAEHPNLNKEREKLLEARRQGDGRAADNLEERIDKEIRL